MHAKAKKAIRALLSDSKRNRKVISDHHSHLAIRTILKRSRVSKRPWLSKNVQLQHLIRELNTNWNPQETPKSIRCQSLFQKMRKRYPSILRKTMLNLHVIRIKISQRSFSQMSKWERLFPTPLSIDQISMLILILSQRKCSKRYSEMVQI